MSNIVSSFFNLVEETTGQDVFNNTATLYGQVIKVHYVDDATNRSKQFVEYDVLARDVNGAAVTYTNVRNGIGDSSSVNNNSTTILEANSFAFSGKLELGNSFINQNGSMVLISFLNGSQEKPYISNIIDHPRIEGPKRAKGIFSKSEFQGVVWEIDNDGAVAVKYQGNRKPNGDLERPDTGPTSFVIDKKGDFEFNQTKGSALLNSEKWERDAKKVTRKVGNDAVVEVWDGTAQKKTTTFKGGLNVVEDGAADKFIITTAGGASITVNAGGDISLKVGGTIINMTAAGKIELTGALVDVGAGASALAALGPQLVAWLSSHTHPYIAPAIPIPGPPIPSGTPTIPPPSSLLSTTVKIKA